MFKGGAATEYDLLRALRKAMTEHLSEAGGMDVVNNQSLGRPAMHKSSLMHKSGLGSKGISIQVPQAPLQTDTKCTLPPYPLKNPSAKRTLALCIRLDQRCPASIPTASTSALAEAFECELAKGCCDTIL